MIARQLIFLNTVKEKGAKSSILKLLLID